MQLAHPVLESLEGMPPVWIKHLLLAFNQGDISKFEQMKPHWETMGDLVAHEKQLRQKITLLCLMEVYNSIRLRIYLKLFDFTMNAKIPSHLPTFLFVNHYHFIIS